MKDLKVIDVRNLEGGKEVIRHVLRRNVFTCVDENGVRRKFIADSSDLYGMDGLAWIWATEILEDGTEGDCFSIADGSPGHCVTSSCRGC